MRARLADEDGQITIWVLGLAIAMLGLGGVSLDLWRVMSVRAELAVIADSASVAGASEVDVEAFRNDPTMVQLDPADAAAAATAYLAGIPFSAAPDINPTPDRITVTVYRDVELTLLKILTVGRAQAVPVSVTGSSEPRVGG